MLSNTHKNYESIRSNIVPLQQARKSSTHHLLSDAYRISSELNALARKYHPDCDILTAHDVLRVLQWKLETLNVSRDDILLGVHVYPAKSSLFKNTASNIRITVKSKARVSLERAS